MLKNKFEHLIASAMEENLNSEEYQEIFQTATNVKEAAFEQLAAKKEKKEDKADKTDKKDDKKKEDKKDDKKADKKVAAKVKKICKLLSDASEMLEDCGCDSGCNCKQMSATCLKMVAKLSKSVK